MLMAWLPLCCTGGAIYWELWCTKYAHIVSSIGILLVHMVAVGRAAVGKTARTAAAAEAASASSAPQLSGSGAAARSAG